MRGHDGRPHWGKLHTRTAADLAPAYPRWQEFQALRDRLDPDRVFTNAYLDRVLGGRAASVSTLDAGRPARQRGVPVAPQRQHAQPEADGHARERDGRPPSSPISEATTAQVAPSRAGVA